MADVKDNFLRSLRIGGELKYLGKDTWANKEMIRYGLHCSLLVRQLIS